MPLAHPRGVHIGGRRHGYGRAAVECAVTRLLVIRVLKHVWRQGPVQNPGNQFLQLTEMKS